MKKEILVKSILFYVNDDGTFSDYLDVRLSTNKPDEVFRLRVKDNDIDLALVDTGAWEKGERAIKYTDYTDISESEFGVLMLVATCCVDYLKGGEPERLDTYQLACIEELSSMFDWECAGYGPEKEEGERSMELTDRIAHFECIG